MATNHPPLSTQHVASTNPNPNPNPNTHDVHTPPRSNVEPLDVEPLDVERLDVEHHDAQHGDQDMLSCNDYVQLTRISRKKDHIEQHITHLHEWAAWDPFQNVACYSPDMETVERNRNALETVERKLRERQEKCTRLEHEMEEFNVQDMRRLRTVAKAISKRHLSSRDTDLLELALETMYTLDKLVRLLRKRRTEHHITQLRLEWETSVCSTWYELILLQTDLDYFHQKYASLLLPIRHSTDTSSNLAREAAKLEASRLMLRTKRLHSEKIRSTAMWLDALIDQRRVPDVLIDEQEKLEHALARLHHSQHTLQAIDALKTKSARVDLPLTQTRFAPNPPNPPKPSKRLDSLESLDSLDSLDSLEVRTRWRHIEKKGESNGEKYATRMGRNRQEIGETIARVLCNQAKNRYGANLTNVLDVEVDKIVNRMSKKINIKSVTTKTLPPNQPTHIKPTGFSAQYWIGEPEARLCLCRILLPSKTVMVRVGGGWQELGEFLLQHSTFSNFRIPPPIPNPNPPPPPTTTTTTTNVTVTSNSNSNSNSNSSSGSSSGSNVTTWTKPKNQNKRSTNPRTTNQTANRIQNILNVFLE